MHVLVASLEETFWDPDLYSVEIGSELISSETSTGIYLENLKDCCWRNIFVWFLNLEGFGLLACILPR